MSSYPMEPDIQCKVCEEKRTLSTFFLQGPV